MIHSLPGLFVKAMQEDDTRGVTAKLMFQDGHLLMSTSHDTVGDPRDLAAEGRRRADEELLRPFVLACNHADISVKLGVMSLSAFQRLLSRGAVAVGQFPNIVRVLRIQSLSLEDDILLRILQTLPLILTATEFEVPEDSLRQAVLICSDLGS